MILKVVSLMRPPEYNKVARSYTQLALNLGLRNTPHLTTLLRLKGVTTVQASIIETCIISHVI